MSEQCTCEFILDNDDCQCSVASSDCVQTNGSGRENAITFTAKLDQSPNNLATCEDDGFLVELPWYISNPPRCQVYRSTAQSLDDDNGTVIAFTSERWDTEGMHDNSVNNSRITIMTAGIYIMTLAASIDANPAGDRQALLRKNGNDFIGGSEREAAVSEPTSLNVIAVENLMVGEYIEAVVKQDSGGSLNLLANPVMTVEFRRLPPT